MESLTFGDIFRFNEREYIFLAQTEEKIYAASILPINETQKIDALFKLHESQNKPTNLTIYCYVILQTAEYKDRAAHLHNTGNITFTSLIDKLPTLIEEKDLKAIKEEIMKKNTISLELKELIEDINL